MKIRFLKAAKYKTANPKAHQPGQLSYVTKVYEAGKTYDLDDDHAQRWLRRGVAVEVRPGERETPDEAELPKAKRGRGRARQPEPDEGDGPEPQPVESTDEAGPPQDD